MDKLISLHDDFCLYMSTTLVQKVLREGLKRGPCLTSTIINDLKSTHAPNRFTCHKVTSSTFYHHIARGRKRANQITKWM